MGTDPTNGMGTPLFCADLGTLFESDYSYSESHRALSNRWGSGSQHEDSQQVGYQTSKMHKQVGQQHETEQLNRNQIPLQEGADANFVCSDKAFFQNDFIPAADIDVSLNTLRSNVIALRVPPRHSEASSLRGLSA